MALTPYDWPMIHDFLTQVMAELRAADHAERHPGKPVHPELDEQVKNAAARRGAAALVLTASVDPAESCHPDYQTAQHKLRQAMAKCYGSNIELLEHLSSLFDAALHGLATESAQRPGGMHKVCTVAGVLAGDVRRANQER